MIRAQKICRIRRKHWNITRKKWIRRLKYRRRNKTRIHLTVVDVSSAAVLIRRYHRRRLVVHSDDLTALNIVVVAIIILLLRRSIAFLRRVIVARSRQSGEFLHQYHEVSRVRVYDLRRMRVDDHWMPVRRQQ